MQNARLAFSLLLVSIVACKERPRVPVHQPKLVVLLVVDQLRADELFAYESLWRHGFRRFLEEGRVYTQAFFRHGLTDTSAGHATIATGLPPRLHGVVANTMVVRERGVVLSVCDFGVGSCSPDVLKAKTLGDRLKETTPGAKVAAMAEKPRAATLLGGRRGDLVAWNAHNRIALQGRADAGVNALPDWLHLYYGQIATPDRIAHIWELPRLPEPFASWPDDGPGEIDCGHGRKFPHRLKSDVGARALVEAWMCSPDSDRALQEAALHVARRMGLGGDDIPDLLAISFGAVDIVGHHYGHRSLERIATLLELDRHLGDLLTGLRELAGPRLLVAFTADHGVAPLLAAARQDGHKSDRATPQELLALVDEALSAKFGPGAGAAMLSHSFVILNPTIPESRREEAAQVAAQALRQHPMVYGAWPSGKLKRQRDPIALLLHESVHAGRAGDVAFAMKPYHGVTGSRGIKDGAKHGSPWPYDRHVPMVLWGDGVTRGRVDVEVDVRDLSRTIADRLGLPVDPKGGRPLP